MNLCKKCEDYFNDLGDFSFDCYGDGDCDKHGRFAFYTENLKIHCYECAVEENKCQMCGEKII